MSPSVGLVILSINAMIFGAPETPRDEPIMTRRLIAPFALALALALALAAHAPAGTPAENRIAIQAALDEKAGAQVTLAPGETTIDAPIWVGDFDNLIGAGSTLRMAPNCGGPCVLIDRFDPGGDRLDPATQFVKLSTLWPIAELGGVERYGLIFSGPSHLAAMGTPFDKLGEVGARRYTIALAVLNEAPGRPLGAGPIAGCVERTDAKPWALYCPGPAMPRCVVLYLGTDLGPIATTFRAPEGLDAAAKVHEFVVQHDLDAGDVRVFWNGVRCTPFDSNTGRGLRTRPGLKLVENDDAPFQVNASNLSARSQIVDFGGRAVGGRGLLGMRLERALIYADDGLGTKARRIDGRPDTPALRYFAPTNDGACFPLIDPPEWVAATRTVKVHCGRYADAAIWYGPRHGGVDHVVRWPRVAGLATAGGTTGVAIGNATWVGIHGVSAGGLSYGINCLNPAVNYPLDIADCYPTGNFANVRLFRSFGARVVNAKLTRVGRYGVQAFDSVVTFRDLYVSGLGQTAAIVRARASNVVVDGLQSDYEHGNYPSRAIVWHTSHDAGTGFRDRLSVSDHHHGTAGPGAALLLLDGTYPGATVWGRNLGMQPGTKIRCYVDASPAWGGDADMRGLPPTTPVLPPMPDGVAKAANGKLRIIEDEPSSPSGGPRR
jgi:hypothetical protein